MLQVKVRIGTLLVRYDLVHTHVFRRASQEQILLNYLQCQTMEVFGYLEIIKSCFIHDTIDFIGFSFCFKISHKWIVTEIILPNGVLYIKKSCFNFVDKFDLEIVSITLAPKKEKYQKRWQWSYYCVYTASAVSPDTFAAFKPSHPLPMDTHKTSNLTFINILESKKLSKKTTSYFIVHNTPLLVITL